MLDRLLYALAERILGKSGQDIVDVLKNKSDVNEFQIAKKLKLTINQTRNLLYKLYAQDIVSFIRKKDKQRGWYIYYWSLNIKKTLELFARIKERELLQCSYLLKSRENKNFYLCKYCDLELTEETSLNYNFSCPECGNLLTLSGDKKKIEDINKEIEKTKKTIEIIYDEINKLRAKEEKIRLRREKREIAQKKKEREKIKKAKKRKEKREAKKEGKKEVSKKKGKPEKQKKGKAGIKKLKKKVKKVKKKKKTFEKSFIKKKKVSKKERGKKRKK